MLRPRDFPETRASLLTSLRDGRKLPAWREFFERYAPPVYRIALLRGLDKDDADDIVQQVMMSVARHIENFDLDKDRGRFRGWIRKITENKIKDYRRRSAPQADPLSGDCTDQGPSLEESWEREWRMQDIHRCLEEIAVKLSPRRIEAFRLYVLEGLSASEVSKRVGMTVAYVYVTRTQIIDRIRERMRKLYPDEGV